MTSGLKANSGAEPQRNAGRADPYCVTATGTHPLSSQTTSVGGGKSKIRPPSHTQLTAQWLPVNPVILQQVRDKLDNGEYSGRPQALLHDLERDIALFGYCIKQTLRLTKSDGSPLTYLARSNPDNFAHLLAVNTSRISTHKYQAMTPTQATAMRVVVGACKAASILAAELKGAPRIAFVSTMIRQLAHALVAWNQPRAYARILSAMKADKSEFDFELHRELGICRMSFALDTTQEWCLGSLLNAAMSDHPPHTENSTRSSIHRICDVAEAIGWATSDFPCGDGESRIRMARDKTERLLGQGKYDSVTERVRKETEEYLAPPPPGTPKPKRAMKFPAELMVPIHKALEKTSPGQFSLEAVEMLEHTVLPAAGFRSGYLFTLDPQLMKFHPILKLGAEEAVRNPLDPVTHRALLEAAFHKGPVQKEWQSSSGRKVTYLAMGIESKDDDALVLYFELSPRFILERGSSATDYFLAVVHCLRRCLGWKEIEIIQTS